MKFHDFLNKCLQDPEFKKYWEEDMKKFHINWSSSENIYSGLYISEALSLLDDEDLQNIIIDKGIKKNISYSTDIIFFESKT